MFGISGEHLLVLLVILLIFGPKRLPDLGHSLGRTMKNFKDAMNGKSDEATKVAAEELNHTPRQGAIAQGQEKQPAQEATQKDPTSV